MNSARRESRRSAAPPGPEVVIPGQGLILNYVDPKDLGHRFIGRISVVDGGSGTGTLVKHAVSGQEYHLVITAAHVIYDAETQGPTAQANFTPAYCPGPARGGGPNDPAAPFGTYQIGRPDMFIAGGYRPGGPSRYDYGALLVRRNLPVELAVLPTLAPMSPGGGAIQVVGYPAISDGNMAGNTGQAFDNGNGLLFHNVSTGVGSSGAPIRQTGAADVVIGVHSGGDAQLDINWGPQMSAAVTQEISDWIRGLP